MNSIHQSYWQISVFISVIASIQCWSIAFATNVSSVCRSTAPRVSEYEQATNSGTCVCGVELRPKDQGFDTKEHDRAQRAARPS